MLFGISMGRMGRMEKAMFDEVEMTKGKAILFLIGLVALGLLYIWGAMTLVNLAHGHVHVGKTVKTPHGVYHKGYTHTHTHKTRIS